MGRPSGFFRQPTQRSSLSCSSCSKGSDWSNGIRREEGFAVSMDRTPSKSRRIVNRQAVRRGGTALVLVALLSGAWFLLTDLEEGRPNFYEPARAPLLDAAMILSDSSAAESDLGQELQMLHRRLDDAIRLLGQAQRLDPQDKRQIDTVQSRLRVLRAAERMAATDPATLQRAYRGLAEQLNTLAKKLEQPST